MDVSVRESGDVEKLKTLVRKERVAEQRDRCLVVLHALTGKETLWIAGGLGRSRAFVQRWVYAYRDGGIEALKDKPRGGSKPKLPRLHSQGSFLLIPSQNGRTASDAV